MKNLRKTIVFGIMLLCLRLSAQVSASFPLTNHGSHYYFTAAIDDVPTEIMLESGLPAFLVNEEFYEQHLKKTDLPFEPSKAKISLFHDTYNVLFRADGRIPIGDAVYEGPIWVLDDFHDMRLPIQYLKDATTNRAVVMIDLPQGCMTVGYDPANTEKHFQKYRLSFNQMGMPTIRAKLYLNTAAGEATLKGDYVVDFGNPMLLFLMQQHKSLDKAVKRGRIKLTEAYNEGVLVAQGIYAEKVYFCGREYSNISIGVTDKMKTFEQLGLIGLPFFSTPIIFDFDRKMMKILQ